MITSEQLVEVGKLNKPHGINGEISATISDIVNVEDLKFIILDIDGIFVPFYIIELRQKSGDVYLLTFEDVNSDNQVREYTNKTIYLMVDDAAVSIIGDNNGMYASDFIGFEIEDLGIGVVGQIIDIDDSTSNVLFVVQKKDETIAYVPIVNEYIEDISIDNKLITMDLPDGLIELQCP